MVNQIDDLLIPNNDNLDELNEEKHLKRKHIIYTAALYFSFISVGLCYSIFNPTLVELATVFESDLHHVSLIFPSRSIGTMFGTLTNGFLTLYVNRQILLFSFLLLKSLTTFLVPHWTTVEQFCINGFFNGFFTSAIVVMVNVWLNELWSWSAQRRQKKKRANSNELNINVMNQDILSSETEPLSKIDIGNVLMQALHFFFGFGCILGPLLAEPFLKHSYIGSEGFFANCLVLPYTIASSTAVISSITFFLLFVFYPYDQPKSNSSEIDSDEVQIISSNSDDVDSSRNSSSLYYLLIFSCSVFLFVFLGSEGTYFQFSASFATKTKLNLSEPNAAFLASSLAISFTAFRAFSVLIALKLTPDLMILLDLFSVVIGNTLVYFFADRNLVPFVIGIILLGAGFASVFPSFFPFLERNGFEVTDMIGSVLTFSGGLAEVLAPFIIGLYIDNKPYVLVYFTFASVTLSFIVLALLNILIWKYFRSPGSAALFRGFNGQSS
ncbi:hypothetical protein BLOT_003105 [Blomia tropicalis]|nr:hypothetical protein BLOT_003105 [Blomia tropicalis]